MNWVFSKADEKAVANGCEFDVLRGAHAVWWIERYCRLYEGEHAGEHIVLRGCAECRRKWERFDCWEDAQAAAIARAEQYLKCRKAGHAVDWQYESTMRLFGWTRYSERWERTVRRFTQASIWIPKKNKKSPTLAAFGLYLLIGDGEKGQHVFTGAKDGTQARISQKHAVEMVRQSPELSEICSINKTTMQIAYEDTASSYGVLSSDDQRAQKSKEGLNGSILIDETHVVDRAFVRRISRAGISRSEPLRIEVSTAGDDPDGYGKERYDYARNVESGEFNNDQLFVSIHGAPQDLTDEELLFDPVKYGRLANPAWGHTVGEEEFLADLDESKASISALADFKMYRLNIWQSSSNPWLRQDDWKRCYRDFSEQSLHGRPCWAGLDLSKTQDMSALVLAFRGEEDGTYLILPFFWLPEKVAREKNNMAPFLNWAAGGYLTLTPGDVVDYGFIHSEFRRLSELFDIREFAYDPYNAEMLTQTIEQGITDANGRLVSAGTGIPRYSFKQAFSELAEPTAEFERLVISGNIHHNGHPILSWQAGHVQVKNDHNGNIRPVKPSRNDIRKIDGIVAGIMGLARAMQAQPMMSEFCATPGSLAL